MFKRLLDWVSVQEESPEEETANRAWLQIMILTALATTAFYAVLDWKKSLGTVSAIFLGGFGLLFLFLLTLLRRGHIRRVAALFGLASLTGMLFATYYFGGVQSSSYFGVTAALVVIAMFLRGRVTILATAIAILFGAGLVAAESQGWYTPTPSKTTTFETWRNVAPVFIVIAAMVGIANRKVRKLFRSNHLEIQQRRQTEAILQEQTRYLAALHETTLAIINRLEPASLLESLLQSALELTGTEHGYIDMLRPDQNSVLTAVARGVFAKWINVEKQNGQGVSGHIIRTGTTLALADYASWPHAIREYAEGFHAIVAVPMKVQGEVIGVIGLGYAEPGREFTPRQISALEQFAELAALAADNARLYQLAQNELRERELIQESLRQANQQLEKNATILERRSQLLQVAAEVSRAASAILDPDQLSQQVVELVQLRFGLYYVGLFLSDEKGENVVLRAATGEAGREMLRHGHQFPIGNSSMVGWCVANRQARIALDVGSDAVRFSNPLLPGVRSEFALPLISRGQVLGALTFQSKQEAAFSGEDVETFQTMADQLANAIQNARLYDQLEKELEERKRAEEKIRLLNKDLEERVERRTMALKASEEKFRALADNNPLRIRRYDREGRCLYANFVSDTPNFNPETIIGKTLREVVEKPEIVELAERCIRQVFETGQPMHTEYQFDKNSYALWWLAPEFGPDGQVISVVTTTLDISERHRMEDELRTRTLELQASNRELESFSYSVSHDLRAPLRALDGFSRILLDDYDETLPEEAKHYLNRIREAAQQMSQLIDDMLRLSRITRAEMRHDRVDLAEIANRVINSLKAQEPERALAVKIHDNLIASGDEGLLRLAMENMLNNAWKFSAKTESAEIEVGKAVIQGKETFFIRDNGVGFDMSYADKLFAVFQRLHSPNEFPGTGIGLAITQRVIHRHGGEIWAESKPGQGATFYFTL